jgi:hypothetical protein
MRCAEVPALHRPVDHTREVVLRRDMPDGVP